MNRVISKDGTEIAYETKGSGKAVILVDGAICYRNFGPMGHLSDLLAPSFKVYIYDRRGAARAPIPSHTQSNVKLKTWMR